MIAFCTHFDRNYLSRGLLLLESLRLHCPDFHLFVFALDDHTYRYFERADLPGVSCIALDTLEAWDPELAACRENRTRFEYYFTLSPSFPLYLLKQHPELPFVCSLDADLFFFSDPTVLFADFDRYSVMITEHQFAEEVREKGLKTGKFNVCFQSFRNDETGLACLERWRAQCIEWCFNRYDPEHDRFADQKYLDEWPALFDGKVKVLSGPTVNLAVWNVNQFALSEKNGQLLSDGQPVVFFHFHGIRMLSRHWVGNSFHWYRTRPGKVLRHRIYAPYLSRLLEIEKQTGHTRVDNRSGVRVLPGVVRSGAVFFRWGPEILWYINFNWLYTSWITLKRLPFWLMQLAWQPLQIDAVI